MGQNEIQQGQKRSARLHIRVTPEELKCIFDKANEQGLTISDFVRIIVLSSKPIRKRANPERTALIKGLGELGKIGSNVNQIAHELHKERITGRTAGISEQDISASLRSIREVSDGLIIILTHDSNGSHSGQR